ncbi:hypothetical protein [Streptomyces bobili]|uniref:hypothetical protein n=1 Tax=Streptomyces bobili TaxID=67280 RepID=UPI003801ADF2
MGATRPTSMLNEPTGIDGDEADQRANREPEKAALFTVVIIAVIVIGLAGLLYLGRRRARSGGGCGLKRRFGPEYARPVLSPATTAISGQPSRNSASTWNGTAPSPDSLSPEAREHYVTQ